MYAKRSVSAALLGAALMVSGAQAAEPDPTQPAQPIVVTVDGGGFHWGDAGLGAAAGVAATLLVLALIFTVRQSSAAPTALSIPHDTPRMSVTETADHRRARELSAREEER